MRVDTNLLGRRTALSLILVAGLASFASAEPLKVCATTPDLGDLVRTIGGDEVDVVVFTRPREDPHFVEARPSFIRHLNRADLYVQMGLELEVGWAPLLLRNARNGRVLPGSPGHVDASEAIEPIDRPTGTVDRSLGHVHRLGNPHYLLDPVNGIKVARLLRDRLSALKPEAQSVFDDRYEAFVRRLGEALVGPELAELYDVEQLAELHTHGRLDRFLDEQGDLERLEGWLGRAAAWRAEPVVGDHAMWNYFARRFGLDVAGYMEPRPGLTPTTRHLRQLLGVMESRDVRAILSSPYFDPRHASFLEDNSAARAVPLAHQVGAREGVDDYVALFDYNLQQLSDVLE